MRIVHFEVDQSSKRFLGRGKKFSEPLSLENVSLASEAKVITCSSRSRLNKEILKKLPRLKLVCTRSTGFDHIDLGECQKRKIAVYFVPDYCTEAVAEHVFAMLLSCVRRILVAQNEVKKGKFSHQNFQGYTLTGKTLGVVGTGRIGSKVIKIALPFGMKVIAYDIAPNKKMAQKLGFKYVSLEKLHGNSDIVSLHVPLVPNTFHLIDEKAIGLMKKGVILINVSRGAVVDTQALLKNIKKFRYLCLDVLEDEMSFDKNNPLLQYPEKILITPHCAFFTEVSVRRACEITMENIAAFAKGDSHNRIC